MNVFNKYVWLVNTLRRTRGATLEELRREWYDTDLNVDHTELNARTLGRWKNDVEDIFGIVIECDPAKRYQYYIANDYGISVGFEKYQPCRVRLKVNKAQRPYTRSLPLHHSQNEVETHEDHSVFEYFIKLT